MSKFQTFFEIGMHHIFDIGAYDHILFIVSLLIVYRLKEWKGIVFMLSAFTIGHGLSMLLSLSGIQIIASTIVEFLIPLSIIIMALYHLLVGKSGVRVAYTLSLLFGTIHGMAYAGELITLLAGDQDLIMPLLGFNLGVELAQIVCGIVFLLLMEIACGLAKIERKGLRLFIFGVIITLSVQLLLNNWIW